ncbi:MATE family efflux transporter [uncultured Methanobrevibacter sp.]|uniref:MATE family efflux transporter n=1 Tax=uncultured Methanobrevibacter sp. TaxID=253161 RepID=UPI0025E6E1A4|nr:MATE family efflux transporter [uncultured Methanobrevibacter sp.]
MQFERNNKLIKSKFWQYFFPTVLSIFASNMAVVVDALIVSALLGVEALSGLQIIFPFICFVNLLCWMIGLGGSLICASAKARFDEDEANKIFSVAVMSILLIGIIIVVIGLIFPNVIIGFLSNSPNINQYALDYFRMYLIGVPFFCFMFCMFYFVRTDGMPRFTSTALIIASIIDPVIDIILINYFHMGMGGSGLATALSFVGGSLYIATYFFKSNRTLKIVKVKFTSNIKDFINICKSGFGGASTQIYLTITGLMYNGVIIYLMGNDGLIEQQICTNTLLIISIFFIGLVQTASPILSVYHQDRDYTAIEYIKKISFRFILITSVFFTSLLVFFPDAILTLYSVDAHYHALVSHALRLYGLYFLTLGFVFFYIFYTQAIKKTKVSNIVSLFFNLILVIVMLMLMPYVIGADGVWITPFCVGATSLLGIYIYSKYLSKKSNGEYHGIFMNKTPEENFWEYTVDADVNEVKELVSLIKNQLSDNKFSDCVCTSLEEFLINIIETNEKLNTIDIILDVSKESVKIYIKDLGVNRNDFTFKNETEFKRTQDYAEVLGMNSNLITIEN